MWTNTIARRLVGRGGSSASLVFSYGRGSIAVKSVGCLHCLESAVCARNPVRQAILFPQLVSPPCIQIRLLSSANEIALQPKPVTPIHQERHKEPPFSFAKMPFIDAFLWKMKKNPKLLMNKKIWSRRSMILPEFVNCSVRIHNGKSFIRRKITESMVGHKFGEFAFTRKRMKLKTNTAKKKAKKV